MRGIERESLRVVFAKSRVGGLRMFNHGLIGQQKYINSSK
jgi:hypothetical protein